MARTYNPFYGPPPRGAPRIRFSLVEAQHLLLAVGALTLAFAFFFGPGDPLDFGTRIEALLRRPIYLIASLLAVSSGFILHELAHKVVAIRYGCWAEFRAHMPGLVGGLLLAFLAKIVLALPGAVVIRGTLTPRANGLVSIAGPATNIVVAAVCLPFTLVPDPDAAMPFVLGVMAYTNALLGVFNLLPFGRLDGRKVWWWNKAVWAVAMGVAVSLLAVSFTRTSLF